MTYAMAFLWGVFFSCIGISLPGLLNLTAAKTSVRDGRTRALIFTAGALVIIAIQAYISIAFAKLISTSQELQSVLLEVGVVLFTLLTIYFLFIAKKPKKIDSEETKVRTKTGRFFLGMLLSALNFFPIPYFVFVAVTLANNDHVEFEPLSNFLFVMGVLTGSFGVFYLYIVFFKKIEHRTEWIMRNLNYLLGSITGVVALINLIKILRN